MKRSKVKFHHKNHKKISNLEICDKLLADDQDLVRIYLVNTAISIL